MIRVKKIQIPTLHTAQPRRLYIYLPRGYRSSARRYPVLYMFDGHNVFFDSHATFGKSWGMKEYLERTARELIVVAIECNHEGDRRLFEYCPWTLKAPHFGQLEGQGDLTMEWITGTLKPQIDAAYRTLPEREHTLIAGSSMGGLMALYAAVAWNDVFSRAAAISPVLWLEPRKMAALIKSRSFEQPTRIYLDMGGAEIDGHVEALTAMFETAKRLTRSGADVAARVVPGAQHCEADWEKRIPVFMDYLLSE